MTYRGHVENGQITLDEPATLPEGAKLRVELVAEELDAGPREIPASSVWEMLKKHAGTIEGPPDWAENHDHYLYGTPKRS